MGAETCPPRGDNEDAEWRDFVASQVTGRGAPGFVDEEDPPGGLYVAL